jgi:hypothetical protein
VPKPLAVAVLVYCSSGADPSGGPSARAPLADALRTRATVVDHAIDQALADRAAGWRDGSELAFLNRGRAALDAGRKARERVEHDESEHQLALAEAAYAEGIGEPGVASLAAEAALEHGVTLAEVGRTDDARAAFERALRFWPTSTLTERVARPDVVKLFRSVRVTPVARETVVDSRVATLTALRDAPTEAGLAALRATLDLDAVIVVAASADGQRAIATRVSDGCSTATQSVDASSIGALLDAPCNQPYALRVDDPRLAAPVVPAALVTSAPQKKKRTWIPYVAAASAVVAFTVIGVTIGFVVSDPRYKVTVSGF